MKKKIRLLGIILTLLTASLLTGCKEKKPVVVEEAELGKKLIDQANDVVNQAQQGNPDDVLNNVQGY